MQSFVLGVSAKQEMKRVLICKEKVTKGIILADGDGDRLGSLTAICPNVLMPVNGEESLISYPIEALTAAEVSNIAIDVGYLGESVIKVLGNGQKPRGG